jgi:hypothetical protein
LSAGAVDHFNHGFLDNAKVAFLGIRDAENEFAELWEHLKRRFLNLKQVAVWVARRLKMRSQGFSST